MHPLPHMSRVPESEAEWFQTLVNLARYLRSPDGCPWDRKQTAQSFARFVAEEAKELDEALAEGDNAHVEEEWGDTLFTLLASLAAAETEGRFTLAHALERAHEKMVRRHGHIFGGHVAETPEEVARVWQEIKSREGQAP